MRVTATKGKNRGSFHHAVMPVTLNKAPATWHSLTYFLWLSESCNCIFVILPQECHSHHSPLYDYSMVSSLIEKTGMLMEQFLLQEGDLYLNPNPINYGQKMSGVPSGEIAVQTIITMFFLIQCKSAYISQYGFLHELPLLWLPYHLNHTILSVSESAIKLSFMYMTL